MVDYVTQKVIQHSTIVSGKINENSSVRRQPNQKSNLTHSNDTSTAISQSNFFDSNSDKGDEFQSMFFLQFISITTRQFS